MDNEDTIVYWVTNQFLLRLRVPGGVGERPGIITSWKMTFTRTVRLKLEVESETGSRSAGQDSNFERDSR
jgi:hypothetical protein